LKLRIKFAKHGNMRFIGHLDIMRFFQKAIRRSGISICYSQGYSPHQIMSFASPLGVGLTSNGEYMDIEVEKSESSKIMCEHLNEQMAEGMNIISCRLLPENAGNAMSIIAAADYTLRFRNGYKPADMKHFKAELEAFIAKDEITILKKTKKSEKEVDIRPMILDMNIDDNDTIFMKVLAGSANNLKPELVMQALYIQSGLKLEPYAFEIQREELYADTLEENSKYVSLENLGEEIEE
jgi:radical SAM-linked protein